MPANASGGKPSVTSSTLIQPTVAAASRRTNSTPVALAVPLTVIVRVCHGLIGPSSMGVTRVDGSGAAHAASAAFLRDASFRNGLATAVSLVHLAMRLSSCQNTV